MCMYHLLLSILNNKILKNLVLKWFKPNKKFLRDSYLCLDGVYSFFTSTTHRLFEPDGLSGCGENPFFPSRWIIIVPLLTVSLLLFLTILTLTSIFLSSSKYLACIASLQSVILPSKLLFWA